MLTESDSDTLIYEALAERLTNQAYFPISRRMRRGSGLAAVRASMTLAIQEIALMSHESGVCFIMASDNDRAPHAMCSDALPVAERPKLARFDQHKADRYKEILQALHKRLGEDEANWQIPVAVALPVEMIESWLLLIARGGRADELPRFSRRGSSLANHFHRPNIPPSSIEGFV